MDQLLRDYMGGISSDDGRRYSAVDPHLIPTARPPRKY
jgi:hypothetical protein